MSLRTLFLSLSVALLVAGSVCAQELPFYQQEPFDRVTLDAANGNAVLKVMPLPLEPRRVPENPRGKLIIRLTEKADKQFEVEWRHIVKVDLFEQMVLAKADQLTAANRFDEAYDYYQFLLSRYADMPDLQRSVLRYWTNNAFASYNEGRYDDALSLLNEVHRIDPDRPGVSKAVGRVTDRLVQNHIENEDYRVARRLLEEIKTNHGEAHQVIVDKWQQRLAGLASDRLETARKDVSAGRWRDAYLSSGRMMDIWPDVEGGWQLAADIAQKYPLVIVGVTQQPSGHHSSGIDHWAARRRARLTHREIVEFFGHGPDGGRYLCPWGTLQLSDDHRELAIRLRGLGPDEPASHTGYGVSRRVLAMADPNQSAFSPAWAYLLAGVTVEEVLLANVQLQHVHVRPEALLQTMLDPDSPDGPYVGRQTESSESVFLIRDGYPMQGPTQPKEVIERHFDDPARAIKALARGDIHVLDRIFPADVSKVRNIEQVKVQRYGVPTLHMLVPNPGNVFLRNRTFRRAIAYGINRQAILTGDLSGGKRLPGCQVISGPFPPGITPDDPIGYACDPQIEPRPFEPRLAFTLARVGKREVEAQASKAKQDPPEFAPLLLAHPATEMAELACEAIARQLAVIEIPCSCKPLAPGATDTDQPYDLLYTEVYVAEPVVDACRLFTDKGVLGEGSPYLGLAIRRLGEATNWRDARERLQRVHRIVHDEVTIVPLWQIAEHFAYRTHLHGLGEQPVTLYQNIEQWQITPVGSEG